MIHKTLTEAAGILWRIFWLGWIWFWSAVGLTVIAMGAMSHDWRAPTTGVLGMAALIATIRIGILVSSAARGVKPRPL